MHKIASTQQSAAQIVAMAAWKRGLETGPKRKFKMSTNEQTKFHLQRIVN